MTTAYKQLKRFLEAGEAVEALVFGAYGWADFGEEDVESPIPKDKVGVVLTLEEAEPHMQSWSFLGGYGAPESYAANIWTNKRVIWVTQYDGSTSLDSMPRNPANGMPDMPGG